MTDTIQKIADLRAEIERVPEGAMGYRTCEPDRAYSVKQNMLCILDSIERALSARASIPKINVKCETSGNGLTGTTFLNVVRVEQEDDNTFTAVTDHWPSARASAGEGGDVGNEWADMATNGVQWLRNIRDGISTADEALAEMESNARRIIAITAAPQPAQTQGEIKAWMDSQGGVITAAMKQRIQGGKPDGYTIPLAPITSQPASAGDEDLYKVNPEMTASELKLLQVKAELAGQGEVEPVAWLITWNDGTQNVSLDRCHRDDGTCVPLYTTPRAAEAEWMPIESAPKDGTVILAFEVGMEPSRFVTQWATFKDGFGDQYTGWVWPDVGETGPNLCDPTHWRPLHAPPALTPPSAKGENSRD